MSAAGPVILTTTDLQTRFRAASIFLCEISREQSPTPLINSRTER